MMDDESLEGEQASPQKEASKLAVPEDTGLTKSDPDLKLS
jgi:hypothetical protein